MLENDFIDDTVTRFTKISNGLASLGDAIDNNQKVRKLIHALPPSWEVKAKTLKELKNKEEMEFIGLWSYTYFTFFSLHSYIYRVINLLVFLS